MENDRTDGNAIGKRAVLEELRRTLDKQSQANDALDSKLYGLLSLSSLIVTNVSSG